MLALHTACCDITFTLAWIMQVHSHSSSMVIIASSSQSVKLAVIGGGISGLLCARVLQNNGREVVVFEREASPRSRPGVSSGNLDMHEESGQWALKQAGLYDQFCAQILEGGQDLKVVDNEGRLHWEEEGPSGDAGRPEIHRPALRNLLLDALQPGTIQWGHQLKAINPQGQHSHSLLFADGSTTTADLVIGADGARSQVRPLVTDAKATYCGAGHFDFSIPDADRLHPDVAKYVGRGTLCALGDNKGVLAQRTSDGSIQTWATCRMSEGDFTQMQHDKVWEDPVASKQALAALFKGWAPEIVSMIQASSGKITPRPFMALPTGLTWPSQPNVTLLGDAAHLTSPFAGEGANMAMQDGAQLALELVEAKHPADAIAAYEAKMFARTRTAAKDSAEGLDMMIAANGAENLTAFMRSAHDGGP